MKMLSVVEELGADKAPEIQGEPFSFHSHREKSQRSRRTVTARQGLGCLSQGLTVA